MMQMMMIMIMLMMRMRDDGDVEADDAAYDDDDGRLWMRMKMTDGG